MADSNWACSEPIMQIYNASGSIGFNPFEPPSANVTPIAWNRSWAINTAVRNVQDLAANTSSIYQTFWLNSTPPIALSSSALPYTGCAVGFSGGVLSGKKEPTFSGGVCPAVLPLECTQAIENITNAIAKAHVGTTDESPCNAFLSLATPPPGCPPNAYTTFAITQPFGNPGFLSDSSNLTESNNTAGCPASVDVGSGNASSGIILRSWNPSESPILGPATNYDAYDNAVSSTWAIALAVFAKNGTPDEVPSANDPVGYWQTALLCITPDEFQAGSRVPKSKSAGGRLRAAIGSVLVVSLLSGALLV